MEQKLNGVYEILYFAFNFFLMFYVHNVVQCQIMNIEILFAQCTIEYSD